MIRAAAPPMRADKWARPAVTPYRSHHLPASRVAENGTLQVIKRGTGGPPVIFIGQRAGRPFPSVMPLSRQPSTT